MATNADSMIEYDLDEEVDRANEWDGSFSELEDLADTVRSAWKERDLEVNCLTYPRNLQVHCDKV